MYTGIVEGKVISTIKEENLMNIPLLIVRKIEDGKKIRVCCKCGFNFDK